MAFTVAIVGRPNVGKSTLFNRLVGRRAALVAPTPGVTRDRREGWARIGPLRFRAIDTAGLEEASPETLAGRMMVQTERALAEADAALLLIDGRAGVTPADEFFAKQLRRLQVPIVLAVNKCEGSAAAGGIAESHALGLGEPIPISAEHGGGLADLYDALSPFDSEGPQGSAAGPGADAVLRLAIVGRPNVGKSTLLNRLVGEARVITGAEPGLTRDSIAVRWSYEGRAVELVDTAGMRRRAKTVAALDKLSSRAAERALGQAAVVLVVLDASEPAGRQDMAIAARVADEGRALVILHNKVGPGAKPRRRPRGGSGPAGGRARPGKGRSGGDLLGPDRRGDGGDHAGGARRLRHLEPPRAHRRAQPLAGRGGRPSSTAARVRPTAEAALHHPGQGQAADLRPLREQAAGAAESYRRYLVNGIGAEFGLAGVPIRLMLRAGKNPYAPS